MTMRYKLGDAIFVRDWSTQCGYKEETDFMSPSMELTEQNLIKFHAIPLPDEDDSLGKIPEKWVVAHDALLKKVDSHDIEVPSMCQEKVTEQMVGWVYEMTARLNILWNRMEKERAKELSGLNGCP